MIDHVGVVTEESGRFQRAMAAILAAPGHRSLDAVPVPSCPDWHAADLVWHLGEVQYFWASIVESGLGDPADVTPMPRPTDDRLLPFLAQQSQRLTALLADRDPSQPCWSWHEAGHNIGWVRRRQAHEALIHRIDAELAAEAVVPGVRSGIDENLAADGVDEILRVMLDVGFIPGWAEFEPDGSTVRLEVPERSWSMALGRFIGTDPSGDGHDEATLRLVDRVDQPSVAIRTSASELDVWLWRRGPLDDAEIIGDADLVERLRRMTAVD